MNESAIAALCRLQLFAGLSEPTLEAVAHRTVIRGYPRDSVLFRQDEPCRGLHVVLSGVVRVYRANADGREQVLHVREAGQPIAEVPLLDGGTYPASARVMEDARLLFLGRDDFEWLYRNHPEVADGVIRELGRRLRGMAQLVEKISLRDVPARVAMTLIEHAERSGSPAGGEFTLPRTQEELASELATTRESVARALSRMRREGLISQRGQRFGIADLAGLQRIAYAGRSQ